MPTSTELSRVTVSQLDLAARQVVGSALGVSPGESVVVLADASTVRLGDALARAVEGRGADPRMVWLDDLAPRPLSGVPADLAAQLEGASASVFVAGAPPDEITMRRALLREVTARRLRHAHLPGVSHLAFVRGLRVDYDVVAGHGMRLMGRLSRATNVVVSAASGTRLRLRFAGSGTAPGARWLPQLGQLEPGRWGNLPAGALYAVPESVDGLYVADAVVGEHATSQRPVALTLAGGRVRSVSVPGDRALERSLRVLFEANPGRARVGLVAVGCNYGIIEPTGEALVDQNVPGLHLGLGDVAADVTGVTWRTSGSLACCASATTVVVEGETVVRAGVLVVAS